MKKPIVIDIVTLLAMLGITILVSIATKGRFGEEIGANQRIINYCIISTVIIIIVTVNRFFFKYTLPIHTPVSFSVGFAIITAFASTVNTSLPIGIAIAGAICLWVCVASDEEIVHKQLFVIDSIIQYTTVLGILYYVPMYI